LGVKYVVFQWKSLTTGNEELGYWSANFYKLSFNGVQIRIWTCINNILKININIICKSCSGSKN
jgi:hypothetical protein